MNIKKFVAISVVIHLIILTGVYFLPEPEKKKTKEFLTSLVTPEEMRRPEIVAPPMPKPVPAPPPAVQKPRSAQPPRRAVPVPPKMLPTPDKPVVPDMGRQEGKPLPEGVTPRPGKGGGKEGSPGELSDKPGYEESRIPPGLPRSTREKLFDRGIIGSAAEKGPGSGARSKKDDAITFDTTEYRFAGYMRKLKEKIESIWEYPADARKRGLYGDLRIRFTIGKDGRLRSVELERTSGYKSLDDAAMKALRDGEPYWPLPDEWGMDTYTINGHFIYTMYGYGLR
ncbi:MAG TPA: TonB family protein [Thermodesulfovibrionales bacterium]|nr:TonB family protein [Thermodesulfovibrionales bacterium]